MNSLARVFRVISVYKPFPVILKRFFDHDCRKKKPLHSTQLWIQVIFAPIIFFYHPFTLI